MTKKIKPEILQMKISQENLVQFGLMKFMAMQKI